MTRVLLLLASLLLALSVARAQQQQSRAPVELTKASEILGRYDELPARLDAGRLDARQRKLIASLLDKVESLPAGDLKTDLSASLHFYEQAHDEHAQDARPARCANERPGAYASLCERAAGDRRALSLAKSRLHATWARAALARSTGDATETLTADALRQSKVEHEFERELAAEGVETLERLGERVVVYDSLGDFEEGRELARVPYERFMSELEREAPRLRRILLWLPPGAAREEIRKATQAYLDGAWWWSKTQRPRVVRGAANSYAESDPAIARPVGETSARYTVALHWRQARDFTRRAEMKAQGKR